MQVSASPTIKALALAPGLDSVLATLEVGYLILSLLLSHKFSPLFFFCAFVFSIIPLSPILLPSSLFGSSSTLRSVGNNLVLPDFDPRWKHDTRKAFDLLCTALTVPLDNPRGLSRCSVTPATTEMVLLQWACLKNQSLTAIPIPLSRLWLRLQFNNTICIWW